MDVVSTRFHGCELSGFAKAAEGDLERAGLLHRHDSKFLLAASQLPNLMSLLSRDYQVAAVGRYQTLYLDTPDFRFLQDQERVLPYHKVRIRHYPQRSLSFLEVKTKRIGGRTLKHRQPKAFGDSSLDAEDLLFVSEHIELPARDLIPQLWTNFSRLTLVGQGQERVTLDANIEFIRGSVRKGFAPIVVEVKQEELDQNTPCMRHLQSMGPASTMSKYAEGIARTGALDACVATPAPLH